MRAQLEKGGGLRCGSNSKKGGSLVRVRSKRGVFTATHTYVTFGVCMYSLAGLLIAVLLWVLFTSVTYVVIATHAG